MAIPVMAFYHLESSLKVQSNYGNTAVQQEQDNVPQEQDFVMQSVEPEVNMDQYEVFWINELFLSDVLIYTNRNQSQIQMVSMVNLISRCLVR